MHLNVILYVTIEDYVYNPASNLYIVEFKSNLKIKKLLQIIVD